MGYDVTALGEILIDFTPAGTSQTGMRLFEQNPGGAPANVLCALAKLGKRCAFIGKIGRDLHGAFLEETIRSAGVDTHALIVDPDVFTTLAFVSLSHCGQRSFSFARKPGADTLLRPEEVDMDVIQQSRILQVGSLSMTDEPARSATKAAVAAAKSAGVMISYDPNYRAPLWRSRHQAQEEMRWLLPHADLVKISDEETELLTGLSHPEDAAQAILASGATCVAVTLGADGAYVKTRFGGDYVAGFPCKVIDTTGAGDAFWAGFLFCFLNSGKGLTALETEDIAGFARFGNALASLCVEKRGAIPAMPNLEQVLARISGVN